MTRKELKARLAALSHTELEELVLSLSSLKEVKAFLAVRFSAENPSETLFKEAETKVWKAFHPGHLRIARGCIAKSTKAINDFKKVCPDVDLLAELLVFQTELIAEFSRGLERDLYGASMSNTAERNVRFLVQHGYASRYADRLEQAISRIDGQFDAFFSIEV